MNTIIDKQKAGHYQWGYNCESWVLGDTDGLSVKQENMPGGQRKIYIFIKMPNNFSLFLKGHQHFI